MGGWGDFSFFVKNFVALPFSLPCAPPPPSQTKQKPVTLPHSSFVWYFWSRDVYVIKRGQEPIKERATSIQRL